MPDSTTPIPSIISHKFDDIYRFDLIKRRPSERSADLDTLEREKPCERIGQRFLQSPHYLCPSSSSSIWNDSLAWSMEGVSVSKPSMTSLLSNNHCLAIHNKEDEKGSQMLSREHILEEPAVVADNELNDTTLVYVIYNSSN